MLNNDTEIESNGLSNLIKEAEKDKKIGLLSPEIYYFYNKSELQHAGCYIKWGTLSLKNFSSIEEYLNFQEKNTICIWGTALLIKKSVVDSIGYLDEKFFAYHEDLDYCLRAINDGFKCKVVLNTKIFHKHNNNLSFMKNIKDQYFYYMTRNAYWLFRKHSKNLNKFSIYQIYLSKIIPRIEGYKELQCFSAIDATLDGLFHAIFNIGGECNKNLKCPKFIKKLITNHPFFYTDLFCLKFTKIFNNLLNKLLKGFLYYVN